MSVAARRWVAPAQNKAGKMLVRPIPLRGLQLAVDLWNPDQQGYLLSYDGNDKLDATVANLRGADTGTGTYEITGFKSTSTANNQTLFASCDTGTTTSFFTIYVASTTGRLTISTQDAAGTVNTVSGTANVCSGARIPTMQVKSSGAAWSFVIDGALDTPIVVAGSNTGDWIGDITLRDNVTHGVKTTTGDGSWAICEMAQHRLYSRALPDAECLINNQRGWKASPSDTTGLVYSLPCNEGTGNPVETVAAVNPTLTGATWVEGLVDRSPNALALTSFGSPVWSNQGRSFVTASSQVIRNNTANIFSSDSQGTILAWVKTSTTGAEILCSGDEAGIIKFFEFSIGGVTAHKLSLNQKNGDTPDSLSGDTTVDDGVWRLCSVVSSGTAYSLYVDTHLESLTVVGGSNTGDWFADTTARDNISIAALIRSSITYSTLQVGEVWYYSTVFSLQNITQIRNTTKWRYGL